MVPEGLAAMLAAPPTLAMRRILALAALTTAMEAVKGGDLTSARLFIEDAQAHLREMAKCNSV